MLCGSDWRIIWEGVRFTFRIDQLSPAAGHTMQSSACGGLGGRYSRIVTCGGPKAGRHDTAPEWQHGAAPAAGNERHSAAPEQCEASFAVGVNSAERGLRCGGAGGSSPLVCSMCCERPEVRGRPSAIYRRPKQGNSCAQSGRCVPIRKRIEVSLRPSPYLAYGNTRTHNRVKNHVSEIKNRQFFSRYARCNGHNG